MMDWATTFSSDHVFAVGTTGCEGIRRLGTTPTATGHVEVIVPENGSWWAHPLEPLSPASVGDLRRHSTPGLWLVPGRDRDLHFASRLPDLEWLKIDNAFPGVTDFGLQSLGAATLTRFASLEIVGDDCGLSPEGVGWLSSMEGLKRFYANWVTDDLAAALLKALPRLSTLDLSFSPITDRSLAAVGALESLEVLDLSECESVSDEGLFELRGLSRLRFLDLEACHRVSDGGLGSLAKLTSLDTLRLPSTITDLGVKEILRLTSLWRVSLSYCDSVGDISLARLGELGGLGWLELEGTAVTDKGLESLQDNPIVRLGLRYTAVSDRSIELIGSFKGLEELDLTATNMTEQGVSRVRALLPCCDVTFAQTVTD